MESKTSEIRSYFSDTYFENGAVSLIAHHFKKPPCNRWLFLLFPSAYASSIKSILKNAIFSSLSNFLKVLSLPKEV